MPEKLEAGLRLAIYARVSTEEQKEGQTIDSQVAELERFAREKGWPITGVYKDDGWSGGLVARPELDRLRDDARNGRFQAVLINDVDRLARDVTHLGVIKRDLERCGVRVIFRKLPSETSPTYNLMVNILGSFAEFEREMISDRTRRGRRHKVEVRKQYLGSNTAYGYRYIPKDRAAGKEGILEVLPEEAEVVRQIFAWVDRDGLSARKVVLKLNELRISPRKGARSWGKSSVLRLLRNEMYAGVWHYNKFQGCEPKNPTNGARYRKRTKCSTRQRPRTEWLPLTLPEPLRLVPRLRWERVQEQLNRNITFSPRNEHHIYLLKGLVECGGCGARYVGDPCHGKYYYRCHKRCKRQPSVMESILDETVKDAVAGMMLQPAVILDSVARLDKGEVTEADLRARQAKEAHEELQRIQAEEDRLLTAYRTEVISPAQLGQQLEKLNARRATAQQSQSDAQPEQPPLNREKIEKQITAFCAQAARRLDRFTPDRWRRFLQRIIHRIVLDGAQLKIHGRIPMDQIGENVAELAAPASPAISSDGRIATMTADLCGRNPGRENEQWDSTKLNTVQAFPCSFDVAAEIVRPPPPQQPRNEFGRFQRQAGVQGSRNVA
jgi:site-specific DNA recombinase